MPDPSRQEPELSEEGIEAAAKRLRLAINISGIVGETRDSLLNDIDRLSATGVTQDVERRQTLGICDLRPNELHGERGDCENWTFAPAPALDVERLGRIEAAAQEVVYWIGNMPSREAVIAGANTEHNQVYGKPENDPWHAKSGESQRHWIGHVEPAVRAAFRREMELTAPQGHPFRKLIAALTSSPHDGEGGE